MGPICGHIGTQNERVWEFRGECGATVGDAAADAAGAETGGERVTHTGLVGQHQP